MNLINDEIKLSRIKSKGGPGDDGRRKSSKQRKAPAWFVDFRNEVMQRFQNIDNRFENIENRLDRQDERIKNIEHELSI